MFGALNTILARSIIGWQAIICAIVGGFIAWHASEYFFGVSNLQIFLTVVGLIGGFWTYGKLMQFIVTTAQNRDHPLRYLFLVVELVSAFYLPVLAVHALFEGVEGSILQQQFKLLIVLITLPIAWRIFVEQRNAFDCTLQNNYRAIHKMIENQR